MSSPRSFDVSYYRQEIQSQLGEKYLVGRELGQGENSIAFYVEDLAKQTARCLKTISPALTMSSDRSSATKRLESEFKLLSKLSHRCIPQVFESNFVADLPYYICSFHPGDTWDKICNGSSNLNVQFRLDHIYYVISSIFDIFEYLHQKSVAHGDFHAKNILVGENIYRDGILVIDFGSSGSVDTEKRSSDFASIGRTLRLFKDKFLENSSHEQFNLFVNFCDYLIAERNIDWRSAKRRLDYVVDPQFLQTQTEFLFSKTDGSRGFVSLPASHPLPIGSAAQAVIDSDAFQRMRGIRQLSFCEWQYPGGMHSRFEHSLGVYGTAKRATDFLGRDQFFRELYEPRDIVATLCSALVHDLGHYPFAHVVEHYVSNRYQDSEMRGDRRSVNHVTFTKDILETDAQVGRALSVWGKNITQDVINILDNKSGALSHLLDGPVDCDKIDYLKRDSYHCGIAYGAGFDSDEIIRGFRCSPSGDALFFDVSVVPAIEGFMILQDQMLSNVYWHPTVRSLFAMFHRFIDAVIGKDIDRLRELVDRLRICSSEYEAVSDVFIPMASNKKNKNQLLRFVGLHQRPNARNVFSPIATFRATDSVAHGFRGRNIFNTIINLGKNEDLSNMPIQWEEVAHLRTSFKRALKEKDIEVSNLNILIDIPWGKTRPRMVDIIEPHRDARPFPITKRSHLSESIFDNPTAYSAPIRVFVPPETAVAASEKIESIRLSALEFFHGERRTLAEESPAELE